MSAAEASPAAAWQGLRRVLLVRLDGLGDVLMSTPAFAAVRESLPEAHLSLLLAPSSLALAPHLPMIDSFIGFHASWMKAGAAALQPELCGEFECRQLLQLQQGRFDAAIIFTVCTQSAMPAALLCRMAGIPRVLAHARERGYGLFSDEIPDRDELGPGMRHEVRRQLDLVAQVGLRTLDEGLRFRLRDSDRAAARAVLQAAGLAPGMPYLLIHPGASAPSRRYPASAYGEVAALMQRDGVLANTQVLFCAGPGEEELLHEARAAMPIPSLMLPPLAELGTLAALLAGARLLVGNNSAPVHLAAAVGTPVVELYALTNPQHTPWRVESRVLNREVPCRDCQRSVCSQRQQACLQVGPREILAAARSLLRPMPA